MKIKNRQDLQVHVDKNMGKQNGLGYEALVMRVEVPIRPSIASLARAFNVTDVTMTKWLRVYDAEGVQL